MSLSIQLLQALMEIEEGHTLCGLELVQDVVQKNFLRRIRPLHRLAFPGVLDEQLAHGISHGSVEKLRLWVRERLAGEQLEKDQVDHLGGLP